MFVYNNDLPNEKDNYQGKPKNYSPGVNRRVIDERTMPLVQTYYGRIVYEGECEGHMSE